MKLSRLLLAALLLASLPLAAQVNDTYIIPASANQNGQNGTKWLTSFSLYNPYIDHDLVISITFVPTGGSPGIEELVRVPPSSIAYSDNLLLDLFGITGGTGSLLVATFAEDNPGLPDDVIYRAFTVTSNTYNNARTGTYGQTIPGIWLGMLDDSIRGAVNDVRNSAASGFRTNIGAVNLGRCSATLRVNVYDADGNWILKNAPFTMPPLGHFQDSLPVQVDAGTVEFWIEDPCRDDAGNYAIVFPYTSTIDQLSGDPRYQNPTLLALAGDLFSKVQAQSVTKNLSSIGKKLDSKYARGVRAAAEHRGFATLTRTAKGWKIAQ